LGLLNQEKCDLINPGLHYQLILISVIPFSSTSGCCLIGLKRALSFQIVFLKYLDHFSINCNFIFQLKNELAYLTVDVELHAGDEVSVANELVEDDVVGPVALPYPNHVVETSLSSKRLG
jgi:hypothetical protein